MSIYRQARDREGLAVANLGRVVSVVMGREPGDGEGNACAEGQSDKGINRLAR